MLCDRQSSEPRGGTFLAGEFHGPFQARGESLLQLVGDGG